MFFFPYLIYGQNFDAFINKVKPQMSQDVNRDFAKLFEDEKFYYIESVIVNASGSDISITKIKIWLEDKIVERSFLAGNISEYDPANDTLSSGSFDKNAIVFTETGMFSPLQSNEGTFKDIFNRVFVRNPEYPATVFKTLTLNALESIKYILNRYANDELKAEYKKDYISLTIAKENLKLLHDFINSKKVENSIILGKDKITYKLNDKMFIEKFSLANESDNYWSSIKNTFVSDKNKVPKLPIKINDFLLGAPLPAEYDKRSYGFKIVNQDNFWVMKKRDVEWAQYLYSSPMISNFFNTKILKINGFPPTTEDNIEKIMKESDIVDIVVETSKGEKSFKFKKIGERERYILNFSKRLNYSPDIYF